METLIAFKFISAVFLFLDILKETMKKILAAEEAVQIENPGHEHVYANSVNYYSCDDQNDNEQNGNEQNGLEGQDLESTCTCTYTFTPTDTEDLTISIEGNQNLEKPFSLNLFLYSVFVFLSSYVRSMFNSSKPELQVEDDGSTGTSIDSEEEDLPLPETEWPSPIQQAPNYVTDDSRKSKGTSGFDKKSRTKNLKNFSGYEKEETEHINASILSTEDDNMFPLSLQDLQAYFETSQEWVVNNIHTIPPHGTSDELVMPILHVTPSKPPKTSISDPPPSHYSDPPSDKPITTESNVYQQEGGMAALVLPSIHWETLQQIYNDHSELVVPPETFSKHEEDSSELSSDNE
ncbi:PREDICTED: uncharacterized protein LOC109585917 [Amphimedon queenslandica]|uniref:Uncharacterized protein n=2 Tax=Amphimedon queenslandica TaxID=400682 RepID=A0AAN0JKR6_AMPQE|nr:PREDICTED: uncharacterized protein LOC109585917 [Amphimedon queenslandica]|eukprot:XP_019857622.1 PREDICTED: uncharacterized protein LOC109585917 [Amphimedon queenslandica]